MKFLTHKSVSWWKCKHEVTTTLNFPLFDDGFQTTSSKRAYHTMWATIYLTALHLHFSQWVSEKQQVRMDKVATHNNQVPFSLETIDAMGSPLTIYGRYKKPHKVLGARQLWSCVWQEMSMIHKANKGLLVGEKWTRTKRRYPSP
jgi:hypothetical protein